MKELESPSVGVEPSVSVDPATSDARLVHEVREGRRASFGVLVRRYEHKVTRIAYRFLRDWATAEDVAQEAFLKAYDNLDSFDVSRRFGPWLFRIAVNHSLDTLRRVRRRREQLHPKVPDSQASSDAEPHQHMQREETSRQVHEVIERLPTKYRTVLILRDLEGFSCSEIAAIVRRREATVRWRLSRARETFRRLWSQQASAEEHQP